MTEWEKKNLLIKSAMIYTVFKYIFIKKMQSKMKALLL